MKKLSITILILLFFIQKTIYSQEKTKPENFKVLAFYLGDGKDIEQYEIDKLTHLIFTFTHLRGNKISFRGEGHEEKLKRFIALKEKYPKLKVLISFGGWGGCETCSDVFASDIGRKEFVISVQKFIEKYKLDGIDIDWESPVIGGYKNHKAQEQDKENFTKLMKELRIVLPPNCELSFDANSFEKFIQKSIDWKAVIPWVDYVNLMTYSLPGNVPRTTAHHCALYSSPSQKESADRGIQELLKLGVPPEKIIIGAAFYGIAATNIENINNGLGQSGKFKGYIKYRELQKNYTEKEGYIPFWNDTLKATHLYNKETKTFITFDDKKSVSLKTRYAIDHQLGGIMFWQLKGDAYRDGLLHTIDVEVQKKTNKARTSTYKSQNEIIKVSENLILTKISDHTYIHTQKNNNGMVHFNNGEALIVSTPDSDIETQNLINWVKSKAKIVAYVIDRWHPDAMEGLDIVKKNKIATYSNIRTQKIAKQKELLTTDVTFDIRKEIKIGNEKVVCHYLGEAHTSDGIVVWIPSEKILFGGNEIRNHKGWIGNIGDANLQQWSKTAKKIKEQYGGAKTVIPGHGKQGGAELIDYTIKLYDLFPQESNRRNKRIANPLKDKTISIISEKEDLINDKRMLTNAKITIQDQSKLVVIEAPKIELNEDQFQINSKTGRVQIYDRQEGSILLRTDVNYKTLFALNLDQTVGLVVVLKEITGINL